MPTDPGTRVGMGAITDATGTTFRVWAPFAPAMHVAGTFNAWSTTATPLAAEQNGFWSVDVAGAHALDEYKFVVGANGDYWKTDPYTVRFAADGVNAVIDDHVYDWQVNTYQTPPWNELVMYELHVGTFYDPVGGGQGTLETAIFKLDYLQELGVNAIEFMPLGKFGSEQSWGYNPAYPFAVDNAYGNCVALKRFVDEAHRRGIVVVMDIVYNHFGSTDLWQFDGWNENGGGGIYFYNDWRKSTPFGDTRPDYGRGEVRQYLRDNALMWLEQYRFDGLRWDATAWIRNVWGNNADPGADLADGWSLMQWINDEKNARSPWKLSIAEDLRANGAVTEPTSTGGAGFSSQWSTGEFLRPIRQALIAQDDGSRSMAAVKDALVQRYNPSALTRVVSTENHDEDANGSARLPEMIWPGNSGSWFSRKRSTLGAGLMLAAPGIPMLFNGQEFLADRYFTDGSSLDWSRLDTFRGVYQFYRDAIRLRRNWFDSTRGLRGENINVFHVNDADKLIAFHRWDAGGPGDDVVVVANFANRSYDSYAIGLPCAGAWRVRLNSDWDGYGNGDYANTPGYDTSAQEMPRDGMPCSGNVGIGPYTLLLLSQ